MLDRPRLNIAFAILRLEPLGGLERHALRLAEILVGRGHRVMIYTAAGVATAPPDVSAVTLPASGRTNHGRLVRFGRAFMAAAHGRFDLLVGFQKLPGLDILFCADPCHGARRLSPLLSLAPRAIRMRSLEASCFAPSAATRIMLLTENQRAAYQRVYGTPNDRIAVLPPTVDPRHRRQSRPDDKERARLRRALALPEDRIVWLWIGLQPHVKGLDRVLAVLARRQDAAVAVCGAAADTPGLPEMLQRARRNNVGDRATLFGHVSDATLSNLFAAADLLVHPARIDVTGTVILEALASGLPVIASAACGYAAHVTVADAGIVLPEPFAPFALEAALANAVPDRLQRWSANALAYAARPRLFEGMERAADLVEAAAVSGTPGWPALANQ